MKGLKFFKVERSGCNKSDDSEENDDFHVFCLVVVVY